MGTVVRHHVEETEEPGDGSSSPSLFGFGDETESLPSDQVELKKGVGDKTGTPPPTRTGRRGSRGGKLRGLFALLSWPASRTESAVQKSPEGIDYQQAGGPEPFLLRHNEALFRGPSGVSFFFLSRHVAIPRLSLFRLCILGSH